MTPAEFEQLLKPQDMSFMFTAADGLRFAEAVASLSEAERKKLSKAAAARYRAARKAPWSNDWEFAALAVLAMCSLSDARKLEVRFFQRQEEAAAKILIDRRPEWLDEWVDAKLSAEHPEISWELLRALIR